MTNDQPQTCAGKCRDDARIAMKPSLLEKQPESGPRFSGEPVR